MQSELAGVNSPRHTLQVNGDDSTRSRIGAAVRCSSSFVLFPHRRRRALDQFSRALDAKLPDPSSVSVAWPSTRARLVGYVSGYCHPTFYAERTRRPGSMNCS